MRAIIDTHVLLWWAVNDTRLSRQVHAFISDRSNAIMVSAATAWEIATKQRIGKLPVVQPLVEDMESYLEAEGFTAMDITLRHARLAGALPGEHRDPFDRMLAAQAQLEALPILSADEVFETFGVRRLW